MRGCFHVHVSARGTVDERHPFQPGPAWPASVRRRPDGPGRQTDESALRLRTPAATYSSQRTEPPLSFVRTCRLRVRDARVVAAVVLIFWWHTAHMLLPPPVETGVTAGVETVDPPPPAGC